MGAFLALQHSTTHSLKIPNAYSRSHFLRATPMRHGVGQTFCECSRWAKLDQSGTEVISLTAASKPASAQPPVAIQYSCFSLRTTWRNPCASMIAGLP